MEKIKVGTLFVDKWVAGDEYSIVTEIKFSTVSGQHVVTFFNITRSREEHFDEKSFMYDVEQGTCEILVY